MFTAISLGVLAVIAIWAAHDTGRERLRDHDFGDKLIRRSIVHGREDLKLIAFLLAGILVMLGVIADILS